MSLFKEEQAFIDEFKKVELDPYHGDRSAWIERLEKSLETENNSDNVKRIIGIHILNPNFFEIPPSIKNLSHLRKLSLSGSGKVKTIPES